MDMKTKKPAPAKAQRPRVIRAPGIAEAAATLVAQQAPKGYAVTAVYPYVDYSGPSREPLFYRVRAEDAAGKKWVRPLALVGEGEYAEALPEHPAKGWPLYGLDRVVNARPGDMVWIVEGEKCVRAARDLAGGGLVAVTSGSSTSAETADWSVLAGKTVTVWPDNDAAGCHYCDDVVAKLAALDCQVWCIDPSVAGALPAGGDLVDWLDTRPSATAADVEALPRVLAHDPGFVLYSISGGDRPEPRDFVLPGLMAGRVGLVSGAPGIGKSLLMAQIAVGIAAGIDVAPSHEGVPTALFRATKPRPVAAIFCEDGPITVQWRLNALQRALTREQYRVLDDPRQFQVMAVTTAQTHVAVMDPVTRQPTAGPFFDRVQRLAEGRGLLIVDPLVTLHALRENDNGDMSYLMWLFKRVAMETGCAILLAHHIAKPGANRRDGDDEAFDARGASAIPSAPRMQYRVRGPREDECPLIGVDPQDRVQRGRWAHFSMPKHNDCAPIPDKWLKRDPETGLLAAFDVPPVPSCEPEDKRTQVASVTRLKGKGRPRHAL